MKAKTFKDYLVKSASKYGTRDEIARRAVKLAKEHGMTKNRFGHRITVAKAKDMLATLIYNSKWGYCDRRVQVRGEKVRIKPILEVRAVRKKPAPIVEENPITTRVLPEPKPSVWARIKARWTR